MKKKSHHYTIDVGIKFPFCCHWVQFFIFYVCFHKETDKNSSWGVTEKILPPAGFEPAASTSTE